MLCAPLCFTRTRNDLCHRWHTMNHLVLDSYAHRPYSLLPMSVNTFHNKKGLYDISFTNYDMRYFPTGCQNMCSRTFSPSRHVIKVYNVWRYLSFVLHQRQILAIDLTIIIVMSVFISPLAYYYLCLSKVLHRSQWRIAKHRIIGL